MTTLPLTAPAADVEAIRRLIARHKTWDWLFGLLGVFALMFAMLVFAMLFGQMLKNGLPHLSWDFFTSFPSRRRPAPASSRPGSVRFW
jgi:phosphate transport system permease protein